MRITYIMIMIIFATNLYAAKEINITEQCVYLDELTAPHIIHKDVSCDFLPGESRYFSKELITSYLKAEGLRGRVINDVKVSRLGENISIEQIREAVIESFLSVYPSLRFEISNIKTPKDLYANDIKDFKVIVDTSKFGSTFVEIESKDETAQSYIFVRAFKKGFIAKERIRTGEILTDKVEIADIDITNIRAKLLSDFDNLIAARVIPKGKVISADLVKIKPSALKGDMIKIVFEMNGIKLETVGILEENAFIGKPVLVKNKDTSKIIMTQYIGNGVAKAIY